eukprot:2366808-Rhodomonas_salina.1
MRERGDEARRGERGVLWCVGVMQRHHGHGSGCVTRRCAFERPCTMRVCHTTATLYIRVAMHDACVRHGVVHSDLTSRT